MQMPFLTCVCVRVLLKRKTRLRTKYFNTQMHFETFRMYYSYSGIPATSMVTSIYWSTPLVKVFVDMATIIQIAAKKISVGCSIHFLYFNSRMHTANFTGQFSLVDIFLYCSCITSRDIKQYDKYSM